MAEVLAIFGGLAAGMQLVQTAAEALLATIKLMRALKGIPEKLALLLNDVDDSITRLCNSCNAGSKLFLSLDQAKTERLSQCATALYPVLQEIHRMLIPLIKDHKGRSGPFRRLWKTLVSLSVEKELSEKLERLDRLNIEIVRELGMIGLEMQSSTQGLLAAGNAASSQGFSNIETQMNSLRSDFHDFTVSVRHAHAIKIEGDSPEGSHPPEKGLSAGGSISGSTITSQKLKETPKISEERAEQMRRYLAGRSGGSSTKPTMGLVSQIPAAKLEFILVSIRTFYTPGNFDTSSKLVKTEFWKDTNMAIYLMKV